jgi:Holliday junction DNA helicase RuvA
MIAHLSGTVRERTPAEVVIDVGGVGYRLFVSVQTYQRLPPVGSGADLFVHTHVREDAIQLYGFGERVERDLFLLLNQVSGIGPRLALNILAVPAADLREALRKSDTVRLVAIPGVGKKTAERLIVELRDKVVGLPEGGEAGRGNGEAEVPRAAVSALVNLGYRKPDAERAVETAARAGRTTFEDLFREALRAISR